MPLKNISIKKITLSLAVCSALLLGGCSKMDLKPFNDNAGKIGGTAIGAGIGGFLGKQLGGNTGMILGALVGGGIGYMVGDDIDKRRAELARIAKEDNIEVYSYNVSSEDMVVDATYNNESTDVSETTDVHENTQDKKETKVVGDVFTIISDDKQFDLGSSTLNATAAASFDKFAQQYAGSDKKILIIGHTDDKGDSAFNQKLSEDRAKGVGEIFGRKNIDASNIYYLGAGETQPIADNNKAEGASKNRRVEIIELNNESEIVEYASSRISNPNFFRKVVKKDFIQVAKVDKKVEKSAEKTLAVKAKTATDEKIAIAEEVTSSSTNKTTAIENKNFIDFNGEKISNNTFALTSSFGKPVGQTAGFTFPFTDATASNDSTQAYINCINDKPRYGGDTKSLATKENVSYKTKEFKKGLNETSWVSHIDNHLVGITPVGVLKDGAKATKNPEINVYENYGLSKDNQKHLKEKTHVNTYQGTEGVLYRAFVIDNSSELKCVDIVFDEKSPNESSGVLYYSKNDGVYEREFKIKQLEKN